MSDEKVLEEYLKTQNSNYFNLLYDRYSDKVFSKCVSMLKDHYLAEDTTQDIFVKVLLNLSAFTFKSRFSTWLYAITYNYCIDVIRKDKKEIMVSTEDHLSYEVEDDASFDSEIKEINVYRLRETLAKMNAEDKSLLLMKYQDDLSIKEICTMTDKSESAVKMKIMRAKSRFLKIYNEEYSKAELF